MGTDLIPIGNHKIKFKHRRFVNIATEIAESLNKIKFVNAEFLRLYALNDANHPRNERRIRKIKNQKEWTYCLDDDYLFKKYRTIDIKGPFGLSLYFYKDYIRFFNPPLRYWQWIKCDEEDHNRFKNEWRKYLHQIVHALGGDRVIYLADNGHPLCYFLDMEVSFEEIEDALKEKFGEPKTSFNELAEHQDDSYMIDYLKNINWDCNIPLNEYYPEPNDLTRIDFDLKEFETKEQMIEFEWHDEVLGHKIIGDKVHFAHIMRFSGVIVEHYGVVGGNETIKSFLDEYAPFTFDKLELKIRDEFNDDLEKDYTINFYTWKSSSDWEDALTQFKQELLWSGNGYYGGGGWDEDESSEWFYAVNEKLALELLLSIGEKFSIKAPIEIVRHDEIEGKKKWSDTIIYKR